MNRPHKELNAAGVAKGHYSKSCNEVAWNEWNCKCLHRGTMEGRSVQVLVDTGCDHTMVAANWVPPSKVDHSAIVPVLYVHGNTLHNPTGYSWSLGTRGTMWQLPQTSQ